MSFILNIRRWVRVRFLRKWSSTFVMVVILLIGTVLLISLLPTGVRGPNPRTHKDQDRPRSPRFPKAEHAGRSSVESVGDEFATYRDGILGNYESLEQPHKGRPGDEGKAYKLDKAEDIDWNEVHSLKNQYGMNIAASNKIPMDRTIPDLRLDECKNWHYREKLPTASVVIVFHNEGFTTLLRTVHSVLIRSPKKLLREVLLVDDFSDKDPLKTQLSEYILEHFGEWKEEWDPTSYKDDDGNQGEVLGDKSGKVRLIRNSERLGLIGSRTRGAEKAVGDVVVFLDAHCEANYNWLVPLLAPIAKNRKTLTVPVIDGIDSETFEYRPVYTRQTQHFRGIFEWGMFYKEIELDMKEHLKTHKLSEPYDSPTHAGGLFAIDRKYFLDLGGYDPGLLVWGGENFELSFKVWQCGGRLQWVPCSRVGHIYRPFMPYTFGSLASKRKGPLVITNYKRVIEVWFDDQYKKYFYTREPLATFYEPGDISKQLEIKERLQCKSFDWFMTEVAPDVYKHFPRLPPNVKWGEVKNKKMSQCLDTGSSSPPQTIHLSHCHSQGGNQLFRLNEAGQLGVGERCVDANRDRMSLIYCKLGHVDGPWKYDATTYQLRYEPLSLCLDYGDDGRVYLNECAINTPSETQQWVWRQIRGRTHK